MGFGSSAELQNGYREVNMNSTVQSNTPVTVSCKVCLEQVPYSEAQMEEASDYVLYFCGLDCYKIWRERADRETG